MIKAYCAKCATEKEMTNVREELMPDKRKAMVGYCIDCGTQMVKARGQGQGVGGPRQGDGGTDTCVCPKCSAEVAHTRGTPCNQQKCPKCGASMVGK